MRSAVDDAVAGQTAQIAGIAVALVALQAVAFGLAFLCRIRPGRPGTAQHDAPNSAQRARPRRRQQDGAGAPARWSHARSPTCSWSPGCCGGPADPNHGGAPLDPARMPPRPGQPVPSDEELRKRLTPLQYSVARESATERPFSNEYYKNHEEGIYVDIVSGKPLFYRSISSTPSAAGPPLPNRSTTARSRSFRTPPLAWIARRCARKPAIPTSAIFSTMGRASLLAENVTASTPPPSASFPKLGWPRRAMAIT